MKKLLSCLALYCFTLVFILFISSVCFAEITRSGSFAFEVGKNNIGVENVNVDLDLYLQGNAIGTQIDIEISKEQTEDELTELNILTSLQGDYYFTSEWFCFGGMSYERNKQWFDDLTTFGAGAGYKVIDLTIQAGLYWATIYKGNDYDRQGLLKLAGDYTRELYKPIKLIIEAVGVVNLEEIQAIDDWEDYRIDTFTMLKADLTEKIFIGAFYEWRYLDNADVTDQWEYGAKAGWNFI